ncbi:MAG: helix-turn-helix transcriptional regulator [Bacilli bacterium]|nr:helix-turn-helix transcriptional regulator [Bacilli bacterium]
MNLSSNLKKIRKENNLSQEDLAEKIGVSRQSVSKWESGQAYPEMDKMVQLCNLFNLNIDDLLNQDIGEVNNTKQANNSINKFIDDFLKYVTNTIDLFSSMKFKNKIKFIFEQCIIIGVFIILCLIIENILEYIFWPLFSFAPDKIYYVIINMFKSLYGIICLILGVILVLHIFKTRYLDYYEIVKEGEENEISDETTADNLPNIEQDKLYLVKKKEKIVIRDPEHTEYRFINVLFKIFLFVVKFFAFIIGTIFCMSLIGFFVGVVLSFMFIKTGMLFIGAFMILISCILVNYVILNMLYDFIFEHKSKKIRLALLFFLTLIICGVGIGITLIGISKFNIVSFDSNMIEEKTIKMNDNLTLINHYGDIQYIESEDNDVKIIIKNTKYNKIKYDVNNDIYSFHVYYKKTDQFDILRDTITDINNKKIVLYDDCDINVYTNRANINKISANLNEYYKNKYKHNYEKRVNHLLEEIETYQEGNAKFQNEMYEFNEQNTELKVKLYECETSSCNG